MAVEKTCGQVLEAVKCRIFKKHPPKSQTPDRAVALSGKVFKAFASLDRSVQAQLLKTFQQWCSGQPLPDGKHKRSEGRSTRGGRSVLRQAFAAPGTRLYGAVETVEGVEVFILVEFDLNKKQQRADQALLEETGRKIFDLLEQVEKLK